jgi:glucose-6-phosphate 1-epimerase
VNNDLLQIDALNRQFELPEIASVVPGNGGLAKVRVTTSLAVAEVYLHGAQVTSWKPAGVEETIFLSGHSNWQDGRAIRGGIPICFPWFRAKADDPKAPTHGFVRTKDWQLDSMTTDGDGRVIVACSTGSDDSTRRWWPHEFRLVHRVTIGRLLHLELTVTNLGSAPFVFEEALHTYFRVGDAERVRVRGLDQVTYLDNTEGNREKVQSGDVALTAPTDNAYLDTRSALELIDPTLHRILRTNKENSASTIVWNPWRQGAASLADLGDDEWRHMTCVEASNILRSAVSLSPGEEHIMAARLSIVAE